MLLHRTVRQVDKQCLYYHAVQTYLLLPLGPLLILQKKNSIGEYIRLQYVYFYAILTRHTGGYKNVVIF